MSRNLKIVLIVLGTCMVLLLGASMFAVFYGWSAAKREGNRAAAIQNLRTIYIVEIQYYLKDRRRSFGTFDQLLKEDLLSPRFSANPAVVDDYVFTLTVLPRNADNPSSFSVQADPLSTTNDHFYLDHTDGEIHVNAKGPAGPNDPKLP